MANYGFVKLLLCSIHETLSKQNRLQGVLEQTQTFESQREKHPALKIRTYTMISCYDVLYVAGQTVHRLVAALTLGDQHHWREIQTKKKWICYKNFIFLIYKSPFEKGLRVLPCRKKNSIVSIKALSMHNSKILIRDI